MPALLARFYSFTQFRVVLVVVGLTAIGIKLPTSAEGQLINVSSPYSRTGDSYFNNTGVNFGLSFGGGGRVFGLNAAGLLTPNINITQGSAASAIPPFGGYDPNAALRSGVAVIGGDAGFSLGLVAGKGSTRSIVSRTPSVTVMNGQIGSIFSGENRPFVTGITPVVGDPHFRAPRYPRRPINYSAESYASPTSTATQGTLSLAEISRLRAHEESFQNTQRDREVDELVTEARRLVEESRFGAARAKYSRALRKLNEAADDSGLPASIAAELQTIQDKR